MFWQDHYVPLSGVYVYRLTAVYSNGTRGTVQFEHTRAEPVNPASLTAIQSDPTSVQLTWQAIPGASLYQIWGPGTAATGRTVLAGTSPQQDVSTPLTTSGITS